MEFIFARYGWPLCQNWHRPKKIIRLQINLGVQINLITHLNFIIPDASAFSHFLILIVIVLGALVSAKENQELDILN